MSLLGTLGLIKEDTSKQSAPSDQAVAPIQSPTPTRSAGRRRITADDSDDTKTDTKDTSSPVNKDVEVQLRKAVDNSGGEGFDYVKFAKLLKKNKSMDENTAYAAALAAAETMGVSVDELVSSAQDAIKAVNVQSKKIDADLAEQTEQNTTDQAELSKVNAQLTSLTTRKKSLEDKIKNATSDIEDAEKSLESTVDLVVNEIKDVISKIKKNSK